jgi:hypothetical protein
VDVGREERRFVFVGRLVDDAALSTRFEAPHKKATHKKRFTKKNNMKAQAASQKSLPRRSGELK